MTSAGRSGDEHRPIDHSVKGNFVAAKWSGRIDDERTIHVCTTDLEPRSANHLPGEEANRIVPPRELDA
jgi:hypothetical protein